MEWSRRRFSLIALLARDRRVMGEHRSGNLSAALVWIATMLMGAAVVTLIVTVV